jgi:hypothetical protein
MFTARRLSRIAFFAIALFAFAQGAAGAMGCTMLRTQGEVAIMPSGEPCEMMGSTPARITLKAFAPDASTGHADDGAQQVEQAAQSFLTVALPDAGGSHHLAAPRRASPRILGPPPYLATLRLRV